MTQIRLFCASLRATAASPTLAQSLITGHGPPRLILPRDKRGARWVRQVVRREMREAP